MVFYAQRPCGRISSRASKQFGKLVDPIADVQRPLHSSRRLRPSGSQRTTKKTAHFSSPPLRVTKPQKRITGRRASWMRIMRTGTHLSRLAVGVVHAPPRRQRSQPAHGKPQRDRHLHLYAKPDRLPSPEHVRRSVQSLRKEYRIGRETQGEHERERERPGGRAREGKHRGQTNVHARWAGRSFIRGSK